jgi:hypothetical protein
MKPKEQYVKDIINAYAHNDIVGALNLKSELRSLGDPTFSHSVLIEALNLSGKAKPIASNGEGGRELNMEETKWIHRFFVDHLLESWDKMKASGNDP